MAEYMLLLRGGERPGGDDGEVSPAEMQAHVAPYRTWLDDLTRRGQLRHANRLGDAGAKLLHRNGSGAGVVVLDGPYTESKDIVGGYYLVAAADDAEAVAIASGCPHLANGGSVEIRRVAG